MFFSVFYELQVKGEYTRKRLHVQHYQSYTLDAMYHMRNATESTHEGNLLVREHAALAYYIFQVESHLQNVEELKG